MTTSVDGKEAVVETHGLTRRFGRLTAVDRAEIKINRGEIFGLLGPNGSGKSTLIRMLCGVLAPSSGAARVLGLDCLRHAERLKPRIGYMSQGFSLYGDLTAEENLRFQARIYGVPEAAASSRIDDVCRLVGIESIRSRRAETLSGGWKRRLALACAIIHEPEVVFLDEPTAGIDPVARRELWDLLFVLAGRGTTLIVTTHYMDEAERCTRVAYMYESRILVSEAPRALKSLDTVTPPGTRRFVVDVDDPPQALMRIRNERGVLDATVFGATLHVLARRELSAHDLSEALGGAPVREAEATLEDVFVALTQGVAGEMPQAVIEPGDDRPAPSLEGDRRPARRDEQSTGVMRGFPAILIKEFAHIRRQPATLFFMFVIPVLQMTIFGYAIRTKIEHLPLVVLDLDGRSQARRISEAFVNTRTFRIVEMARNERDFRDALISGRASVGLKIPPNYTERVVSGRQASLQVLVDGSDSLVAGAALEAVNGLGFERSFGIARRVAGSFEVVPARDAAGNLALPIEIRPRLLYNPALESSHFFVPGLIAIILQLVTLFLTSFAIVRERELGTMEQLFVTPVGRGGLILGKLAPYAAVGIVETVIMLICMTTVFGVPINGDVATLLVLSAMFIVCSLGLGLLISTLARTQLEAMQFAFLVMLPSVLLSGFMFPRDQMPASIHLLTHVIPATYFVDTLRAVVLRGAELRHLSPQIAGLAGCAVVALTLAALRFRKRLG